MVTVEWGEPVTVTLPERQTSSLIGVDEPMAKRSGTIEPNSRMGAARPLVLGLLLAASLAFLVQPLIQPGLEDSSLFWVPFLAVGCLILLRASWHPMGWLLMATGLALAAALSGLPWVPPEMRDEAAPWTIVFALFAYITLVFPTGRLDSWTGWRATVAKSAVGLLVIFVLAQGAGLIAVLLGDIPDGPVWTAVLEAAYIGTLLLLLGGAVSLVFRFRHSIGERRAQLSWVVAALTLLMISLILTELTAIVITEMFGRPAPGDEIYLAVSIAFIGVPVAIMVAILRYRLYDLGRLVRRTVSYSLVVAVLVAVYALGVLGLGSLIGRGSPLVVAGSTLAAAAVFNPVRHRVQRWVDSRFDRQHYDAQRLVDEFTGRLRNQVEFEELIPDLTDVIGATLRPSSISLWVRDGASP